MIEILIPLSNSLKTPHPADSTPSLVKSKTWTPGVTSYTTAVIKSINIRIL
jgi:hypothetical protein